MAYDDSSASARNEPWIQWFCGLKGHEMFCEVERSYIEDGFNLYGLRACVANFSDCLDLILDRIGPDDSDDSHLTQSACTLYGLIHARYLITSHGLDGMYNKYVNKDFGSCPLLQCCYQAALPVGLKDEMGSDTVKIFCPKCQNVYQPPQIRSSRSHSLDDVGSASVDGAAFGTTFPHLFLMTFHNLVPEGPSPDSKYVPRIFGFRVHKSSKSRNDNGTSSSVAVRSVGRRQPNSPLAATSAPTATDALNTADVEAADAYDESTRAVQLGQEQGDSTAATPATGTTDNAIQTKNNKGSGASKNKKGVKGKQDESAKRKSKNSTNGDVDGKSKRQKRGGLKT